MGMYRFRLGIENKIAHRDVTTLRNKLKINDNNIVTFNPAFVAALSTRKVAA